MECKDRKSEFFGNGSFHDKNEWFGYQREDSGCELRGGVYKMRSMYFEPPDSWRLLILLSKI